MTARTLSIASLALVAMSLPGLSLAQAAERANPRDVMAQINKIYQDARAKQAKGETINEAETQAQALEIAQNAVKDLDPQKIPADEAADWIPIFLAAKRESEVGALAVKGSFNKTFELSTIDSFIVIKHLQDGKYTDAKRHIRNMGFTLGPSIIGHFHQGIRHALSVAASKNLSEVISIYDTLIARVNYDKPLNADDKKWAPVVYADLESEKAVLLYNAGQKEKAVKDLKALAAKMAKISGSQDAYAQTPESYVTKKLDRLTSETRQGSLTGSAAPALIYDRFLGDFKGPESLKGKVVILDFMAHWCGPCKAALPDIAALQDRLGAAGLQTVSLTGYYGYYGAQQGISKDVEFDKMKGFVKDFKITWPVLFDGTSKNNGNYGVSGIPQLVVIDRKGVVRRVEVGFTKERFAETVKLVEKLLVE
jgi:thiol-disulfide isomerase/thioredoxin